MTFFIISITIDEIIEAEKNGTLEEAFGTGTAVNIAMIETMILIIKTIEYFLILLLITGGF